MEIACPMCGSNRTVADFKVCRVGIGITENGNWSSKKTAYEELISIECCDCLYYDDKNLSEWVKS